jgi:hypothetical protein
MRGIQTYAEVLYVQKALRKDKLQQALGTGWSFFFSVAGTPEARRRLGASMT